VRSVPIAVIMLIGVGAAPAAFAKIILNTIDSSAVVTDDGRHSS